MSFIDDMKIGKKLIGGYLIVVLILVVVAAIGYTNLATVSDDSAKMYNERTVPIAQLGIVDTNLQHMRAEIYRYIFVPDSRAADLVVEQNMEASIKKELDAYRTGPLTDEEKTSLAAFDTAFAEYVREYKAVFDAADKNDMKTVNAALAAGSPLITSRNNAVSAIQGLVTINLNKAKALDTESDALAASAEMMMIIATIMAVIIAITLALYLTKSITRPIGQVANNIKELSKGHLSVRLNFNRKDEIGEIAKTMDSYANGQQKWIIGTMKMIANGDLSRDLKAQDAQDEVVPAINTTTQSLRDLIAESNKLSIAAVEGKLSVRGDAEKFKGGYWEIIAGINKTFENVVLPLNEGMRVSQEYASGNFTARFDDSVKVRGDFKNFKISINNIGTEVSKSFSVINQQVGNLAASAEEANASVEEVSAGSAQVAKNASGVSVNAEKATEGIEQVQKAMEDLSRTIQDVATKSEAVAKIVQDTTTYSREGMELAQKTEQGMQGITKSSNDVNQIIGEIKGQMDKISEIVNLITDLANQTNLLALNAAIEAARAGDAGRGFAVVATEVKSLAVESRASAERISAMIDNLQKQTLNAVNAVTSANNGVREGSEALHETLASFSKIVSSIDKISQNVSDVAAAAEEQAASVQEVTASVNEVGGLMQNTTREATDAAAASEESSAAIDQITKVVANVNAIVDKVTTEVSRFRV